MPMIGDKAVVQIHPDNSTLFSAAAARVAASLEGALRQKPAASLVLTGGRTPRPVYELLSSPPLRERIDWARIHFFWGDERCVPPDHTESNFRLGLESLIGRIPAAENHVHRMRGEMEDHDKAALLYETEIRSVFPGADVPDFDLVLLGMGEDGHTASLFPGTQWNEERLVVANHVGKFQAWRLTMTPRLINAAREVLFLTAGQEKARALAGVLEGPPGSYPAQRIRPANGSLTWMVDSEAASLLK